MTQSEIAVSTKFQKKMFAINGILLRVIANANNYTLITHDDKRPTNEKFQTIHLHFQRSNNSFMLHKDTTGMILREKSSREIERKLRSNEHTGIRNRSRVTS